MEGHERSCIFTQKVQFKKISTLCDSSSQIYFFENVGFFALIGAIILETECFLALKNTKICE